MPDWNAATADLADGDYATSELLARRGPLPADVRAVPLARIPVKDVNWFQQWTFGIDSPALPDEYFPPLPIAVKCRLPANMAGSLAAKRPGGVNPGAAWALRLFRASTQIATLTISSAGVVTLATVGGTAYDLNVNDVLTAQAPTVADASIRGWGFNILLLAIS